MIRMKEKKLLGLLLLWSSAAMAQHARDNAVVSAVDAFGMTIGTETIGLYTNNTVRGFNPQVAGNVRIDGLYFDQQANPTGRMTEGSGIRVGISALDYPFPAPTGIIDYELRHARDAATLTTVAYAGPFSTYALDVDGQWPLASRSIQLPLGMSYRWDVSLPRYTAKDVNFGGAPIWTVNDRVRLQVFWDRQEVSQSRTFPTIFLAGSQLPPDIEPRYYGQDWAEARFVLQNYGGIVDAELGCRWKLAAGVFHSISDNHSGFADLYIETTGSGSAHHELVSYANQHTESTSGEIRLTGQFVTGSVKHELVVNMRGRDVLAYYGGADVVDFGNARAGQSSALPEPDFTYGPLTRDRGRLWTAGWAYRGRWAQRGELSFGVQKSDYTKFVAAPDEPAVNRRDDPWRFYGNGAVLLSTRWALYGAYTQGLEDAGIAPGNAANRGAVLPATRTSQAEVGFHYSITTKLKLTGDLFDIRKPYFNLDPNAEFVDLGEECHRGMELSLAGEVLDNLHVVAGGIFMDARVSGRDLASIDVGSRAPGQPRRTLQLSADYRLPWWPSVSGDLKVIHYGSQVVNLDNSVEVPSWTALNLGARYSLSLWGAPSSLRLLATNITNSFGWLVTSGNGLQPRTGRGLQAYLTTDIL
jgi:iron complex outermembrane receptor protein